MSHMVETMAYSKAEVPWHGLGKPVEADLTPIQMMNAAQLNWTVEKRLGYSKDDAGNFVPMRTSSLYRSDGTYLGDVPNDWNVLQNETAFEFFNDWCAAGEISMETAGSLRGGELVWGLAKMKDGFKLFGKDETEGYILFTNPHRYGWSISTALTPIRVVCWNTLTWALSEVKQEKIIKVSHRSKFDADKVKETMGVAKEKLAKYKEMATFLGSKKAKDEDIVTYFKRIFPVLSTKETSKKELSKSAEKCKALLETQPGANFGKGTWWQPFNAVTYYLDHEHGRTQETRLHSAWYGDSRSKKTVALKAAVEMAEAA